MAHAAPSLKYVVVLGGSAGAFPTLLEQVTRLFARDSSCLFIIYHPPPNPEFAGGTPPPPTAGFRGGAAADGEGVVATRLYYPPDGHDVEVENGKLRVAPPHARYRPNIDRLLRSLAREYGNK